MNDYNHMKGAFFRTLIWLIRQLRNDLAHVRRLR